MKLLVVIAAFIALCSGNPIPLVPGDNSDYVEGESRYIWMPDGEGVPHLVDLEEREDDVPGVINGADNEYWLFTRANPSIPQIIVHGDANTIWNSNYVASRPLTVIVHGWNSNGNSAMNPMTTQAFLSVMNANVIVVDWRRLANRLYWTAVSGTPDVGVYLGNFLIWLIDTAGGSWDNVHLVGFSLGAHAVGSAGRTTGGLPARITGLDPAGPYWGENPYALAADDGRYVEAIHTNGGALGIFDPIAAADFYPNGGRNQPGCSLSTCSHSRAYELFASSVRTDRFVGRECEIHRTGGELNMGNSNLDKQGSGIFCLWTGNRWPY